MARVPEPTLILSLASIEPSKVEIPAVTTRPPVVTLTPLPAVTIPTESTLVTSSYVNVPPIVTFPLNIPSVAVITPVIFAPPDPFIYLPLRSKLPPS